MSALLKKLIAGGSITTIILGLVLELNTIVGEMRSDIGRVEKDIAVLQKSDNVQDEQSRRIYKKLDTIESDIKTLLQRK